MWHPSLFNWLSAKTACDVQVVSDSAKEHVGIFVQDSQALTLHAWCQSRTDPNAIQCNTKRLEFAIVCKGPFWHSQTNLAGPNTTVEDARILESEVCMRTSGIGWAHWAPQAHVLEHQVGITILPSLHHTSGAHLNEWRCFDTFDIFHDPWSWPSLSYPNMGNEQHVSKAQRHYKVTHGDKVFPRIGAGCLCSRSWRSWESGILCWQIALSLRVVWLGEVLMLSISPNPHALDVLALVLY